MYDKDCVRYKMITSQNKSFETQAQIFFILQESYIPFLRYSSFAIFNIPWFTKSLTLWRILVHETGCMYEYIFWTTTHLVTKLGQLIDTSNGNSFQESFEQFGGLAVSPKSFSIQQLAPITLESIIKSPVFYFFEKMNNGLLRITRSHYIVILIKS